MALCSIYRSNEKKPLQKAPSCVCAGWEELPPEEKCTGGAVANALSSSVCLFRVPGCFCRSATKLFLVWARQLSYDPSVASKIRTNFAPLFYRGDIDQHWKGVTWVEDLNSSRLSGVTDSLLGLGEASTISPKEGKSILTMKSLWERERQMYMLPLVLCSCWLFTGYWLNKTMLWKSYLWKKWGKHFRCVYSRKWDYCIIHM